VTHRSLARRMLLVCAVLLLAAQFAGRLADELGRLWIGVLPVPCRRTSFGAPDPNASFFCTQLYRHPSIVPLSLRLLVLGVMLAICVVAVRWCVAPVRDIVLLIADVGPQNLGHRLRPGGRSELATLGRAIDEMMDRIAVGYDAQRRFAADASHELRTPLAVQRALIEIGMAQDLTAEQIALLSTQLLETNQRNERLIEGLLVLSESDRGLISRSPVRLDEVTRAVLDAHQTRAEEAGVTVTAILKPRTVIGEQVLLERLVTNLIQNAVKYNRPDGTNQRTGGRPPRPDCHEHRRRRPARGRGRPVRAVPPPLRHPHRPQRWRRPGPVHRPLDNPGPRRHDRRPLDRPRRPPSAGVLPGLRPDLTFTQRTPPCPYRDAIDGPAGGFARSATAEVEAAGAKPGFTTGGWCA
jgi:signal transduction histidine kinase